MTSPSVDQRLYITANSSERDKIDKALRLPGLHFPKNQPVLGKKQTNLMLALAAFDTKRNRAGKQIVVVRRLCVLYNALLNVHKDHPVLDINGDAFYQAALDSIAKTHQDSIAKYLTPVSLHHVVELYRKAFHYGGLKPKRTYPKKNNGAQETGPVQRDASQPNLSQPNGNGGESFIGQKLMWPSETLKQKGARVELQELVEQWMIVRGVARRNEATAKETQTIGSAHHPEQPQDEPAETHTPGLQPASEDYREERKPREEDITESLKAEKQLLEKNEMLKKKNEMLKKENEMLKKKNEMLKKENEMLKKENEMLKKELEERNQLIRRKCREVQLYLSGDLCLNGAAVSFPDIETMDQLLDEIFDSLVTIDDLPGRRFPRGS